MSITEAVNYDVPLMIESHGRVETEWPMDSTITITTIQRMTYFPLPVWDCLVDEDIEEACDGD